MSTMNCVCLALVAGLLVTIRADGLAYKLDVESGLVGGPLNRFWRSTGFCPPDPHDEAHNFDLSDDMAQNLAYMGALPQTGIEQVRIHYLLDLVTVQGYESGKPVYNFTHLDSMVEMLFNNGLHPGFEIMGNPSSIFTDFENTTQVYMWKDLVQTMAQRYIDEFGLGFVMTWNFETWNEPDCHDFNNGKLGNLQMTVAGFLNYYDACSEGLKAASERLKLGGPGDSCGDLKPDGYAFALYFHIVDGKNFFTNETGVRLDYVSLHRKGSGSAGIIRKSEEATWIVIQTLFPSLADVPFYNDEADPLVGWSRDEWWRADSTYAAVVAKVISQHQNILIAPSPRLINYTLLSNDNGFLSYYPHQFTQRTLLARFQMNNTSPPHVQFVRKPVYSAMSLLSLLGEQQLWVTLTVSDGATVYNDSEASVLATVHVPSRTKTADSWQLSVLLYNSDDTSRTTGNDSITINLNINPPTNDTNLMLARYRVAPKVCDPYYLWTTAGKPDYPSWKLFQELRNAEGPCRLTLEPVKTGQLQFPPLLFEMPEVSLIHVCAQPTVPPDQVNGLNMINITSGQVLVIWSDKCVNSRCIKTFEVDYSNTSSSGPYVKVNVQDSFVTAFVFAPEPTKPGVGRDKQVKGFYRVRAVDYWGRPGLYSLPAQYPATAGKWRRPRRDHAHC